LPKLIFLLFLGCIKGSLWSKARRNIWLWCIFWICARILQIKRYYRKEI